MKKDFVEERRGKILEYVNEHTRADIGELASIFDTTEATIRRDVALLESQNLVHRVHGGILRREQPSVWRITSLHDRMGINAEAKERIADAVGQLVRDGESIMIDGGSTTMLVAQKLRAKRNLLVVSNAPAIGHVITEDNDNKVILTGGELLKETASLIGSAAEHSLAQYRSDKAIVGVSGILTDEGCFAAIPQEAEIKRLMSLNSRETIVVADSSKIDTRAFCFIFDFTRVDTLVTDRNIGKAALERLREHGIEVLAV
ncbi:MAG: DeoR/GlpR family DNA-binding transcription regulator [Spirochaetales bacterium]|nr:DeoR/GlpR family DNA-binding transcription regulator [Spirochaetales bacterium]